MNTYNKYNMLAYLFLAVIIIILIIPACTATSIQKFSIDSKTYSMGDTISVSGEILDGNASGQVEIIISNDSAWENTTTVKANNSIFSATIIAPAKSGNYMIKAQDVISGTISPYLNFTVLGINDPKKIKILFTQGQVLTVSLSTNHNIQGPLNVSKTGGSIEFDGTDYYFLVSDDDTVYMDDDDDMNLSSDGSGVSTIGNLVEGSKVKLNATMYTLIYVDNATEIVLARPIAPVFQSGGDKNITLLALNASDYRLSNIELTLDHVNDNGTLLETTTVTTDKYGVVTTNITIQSKSGLYHFIAGDVGHISYSVNTYSMYGDILSPEYKPQHQFARDDNGIFVVYLKRSTGMVINGSYATVTANIKGPKGYNNSNTLSFNSDMGFYNSSFTIPDNAPQGDYKVEYIATIGSSKQKSYIGYQVRGYDIFLFPVSPQKHDLEGFAPDETGYIFVGGFDMSTGTEADINGLTDNSNKSKFSLTILDTSEIDVTGEWSVINLTTFFDENCVDPWMQTELKNNAKNASIINFTTPLSTGIFNVKVTVDLDGTVEEEFTGIGVQNIFVHGQPSTSDGNFAPMVSRNANITLKIMAFDPKNMEVIPSANITDAGLIEVYSESEGALVTEYMENPHLVDIQSSRGLRFYVNDSSLGFHHVKFWINATLKDGTSTQAVGHGFFDTKLYFIWACPATEGGMFKTFTSTSDIKIEVTVEDSSHSPVEDKLVTAAEIRYGETWEKISFDTTGSNVSGTTDKNGTVILTINATNPLKSGWYDVSIKVNGNDPVTNDVIYDYGHGWFEVRSFMFDIYPEMWNIQAGEDISFIAKIADPSNMSLNMISNITLDKIYYMGSWENPQPPTLIGGSHTIDPIQIETNATTSETIEYTDGAVTKSGMYEFVFEAESGGNIETRRAWVESNPFVAWAYAKDWNNRFGVGENMSIIVEASDSWMGGNKHNITSATNVTMVMKEGMFGGTPYKTSSDLNISSVVEPDDNNYKRVNLTIDLTGWDEGSYFMTINVVDEDGDEVFTHFWFQVEIASVGLPEFYWIGVDLDRMQTTKTSIFVNDTTSKVEEWEKDIDGRYPGLNYSVATNSYVGKVAKWEIELLTEWEMEEDRTPFWILVNLTSPRNIYINYNNCNFSDTKNTTNLDIGETFNEKNNTNVTIRQWNVTSIGSDGSIEFTGKDCLSSGYNIDTSLSKSGEYIISDWMQDCDRLNIDLDGNGDYRANRDSRENIYYLILADNETAGIYDTVLVANTSNFSNAIDASAGDPVEFGGAPIYLVNMMFQNNRYEVKFTSYKMGWSGEWLGTFQNGKNVTIPFLIQKPGATDAKTGGIANANVTIDKLTWFTPGFNDINIDQESKTNEYGLAMLTINTSEKNIPNGQYLLHYEIELPTPYNTTMSPYEMWNLPGLELRSFVVDASIGTVGDINVTKVSDGNGLSVNYGKETEAMGAVMLYGTEKENVLRIGWPFDMQDSWTFNTTNCSYHNNLDDIGDFVTNDSINLTMDDQVVRYNFTDYYPEGNNVTIELDCTETCWEFWDIKLSNTNPDNDTANIEIDYLLGDDWYHSGSRKYSLGEWIGWGPGELHVNVSNITSQNVTLKLYSAKALYKISDLEVLLDDDPDNGELESGRVSVVSYKDYTVYGYNDADKSEVEKYDQWCNTFDRVLVANSTFNESYRIGVQIPVLDHEYVAVASPWGGKIIFANASLTHGIYPFSDWAPDGDSYYVGNFTEADVNTDLNDDRNVNDTQPYYMVLEDNCADGKFSVNSGRYDDDNDLTDRWGDYEPIDMYGEEGGTLNKFGEKFDERWVEIGTLWGWPISFPVMKETVNNVSTLITIANKEWEPFNVTENVSIFLTARTFTNQEVNGSISVDKLMVMRTDSMDDPDDGLDGGFDDDFDDDFDEGFDEGFDKGFDMDMMEPTIVNLDSAGTMTNGIGTLIINNSELINKVGEFSFGDFVVLINLTDSSTQKSEIVERHFMMENMSMMYHEEGGVHK